MKVAIIGAGAMGSAFGAFLSKAGEDVCLVDVRREHIELIKENGLLLRAGEQSEIVRIKAAHSPEEAAALLGGEADVILILVKTMLTEQVLAGASALIGADTYLVTTQNGVGSEEVLAKFVGRDHVMFGTSAFTASVETAGTVQYTPRDVWATYIMPLEGEMNETCAALADALTRGGHPTFADMDTARHQWQKIVVNCAANAASAVLRLKSNVIFSDPDGKAFTDMIADEVLAVAGAKGVSLKREDVEGPLAVSAKLPAYPSMGLDAIHHRETEVDSLNGAIARLGKQYGIATPANESIYHLVKVMESHYDQLPEGY